MITPSSVTTRSVSADCDEWPVRLLGDPAPPSELFVRGCSPRGADRPSVAIVGTRRSTGAGDRTAFELARGLVELGIDVVSGLALGIDGAAHAGAVDAVRSRVLAGAATLDSAHSARPRIPVAGVPMAVVGSGVDVVYPREHRQLWAEVVRSGCVTSEHADGVRPRRWHFPRRNRLIAALADVVVVVESGEAGGALGTVEEALLRDRPVMAVPGPLRSPASAGCLNLLADGAHVCRGLEDVVGLVTLVSPEFAVAQAFVRSVAQSPVQDASRTPAQARGRVSAQAAGPTSAGAGETAREGHSQLTAPPDPLDPEMQALRDALSSGPAALDDLAEALAWVPVRLARLLARAEAMGCVRRRAGWFEWVG